MSANEHVDNIKKMIIDTQGFDKIFLDQMTILQSHPTLQVTFNASLQQFVNIYGTVHGGVYATLVDLLGGIVITLHNFDDHVKHLDKHGTVIREVSSDINITYIQSAKRGDTLFCEAKLLRKGKHMAFTETCIYKDKTLLATGRHTKFIAPVKL